MPMFEFTCKDCSKSFEELVFTTDSVDEVTCPTCKSHSVAKRLSAFSVGAGTSGSLGGGDYAPSTCSTGSCCSGGNCGF